MIKKVSTRNMSEAEWRQLRMKSIGGSDAGALMGLNEHKSPYALWAEKTGLVPQDDLHDKEAVRLGCDLEQYVADRFMEATGKRLRKENSTIYNTDLPFAHANIDRAVIGEPDAGFEAKTTSSFGILQQCREGQYPDAWYCQMTHYMMVTGAKRWYLGVLCLGHGFFHFTIERNEDEISALASVERDFWQLVENKTPPDVDGMKSTADAISVIYQGTDGVAVDLGAVSDHLSIYLSTTEQIKQLEGIRDAHKAAIMEYMGNSTKGVLGAHSVLWKPQTRKTFNRSRFEADHGKIPAEYFNVTTTRPFKIS